MVLKGAAIKEVHDAPGACFGAMAEQVRNFDVRDGFMAMKGIMNGVDGADVMDLSRGVANDMNILVLTQRLGGLNLTMQRVLTTIFHRIRRDGNPFPRLKIALEKRDPAVLDYGSDEKRAVTQMAAKYKGLLAFAPTWAYDAQETEEETRDYQQIPASDWTTEQRHQYCAALEAAGAEDGVHLRTHHDAGFINVAPMGIGPDDDAWDITPSFCKANLRTGLDADFDNAIPMQVKKASTSPLDPSFTRVSDKYDLPDRFSKWAHTFIPGESATSSGLMAAAGEAEWKKPPARFVHFAETAAAAKAKEDDAERAASGDSDVKALLKMMMEANAKRDEQIDRDRAQMMQSQAHTTALFGALLSKIGWLETSVSTVAASTGTALEAPPQLAELEAAADATVPPPIVRTSSGPSLLGALPPSGDSALTDAKPPASRQPSATTAPAGGGQNAQGGKSMRGGRGGGRGTPPRSSLAAIAASVSPTRKGAPASPEHSVGAPPSAEGAGDDDGDEGTSTETDDEQYTNATTQGTATMLRLVRDALTPNTRLPVEDADPDADRTQQHRERVEQELLDAVPPRQDF